MTANPRNSPDRRGLGASLKRVSEAFVRCGDAAGWSPAPGSATRDSWQLASDPYHPLERTLLEADVAATLLIRSAIDHVAAVGDAVSTARPLLPFTIGRTAVEHALRAVHLLDEDATPEARAERRLNEWIYAVEEAERLRHGVVLRAPPDAEPVPDYTSQREAIQQRAAAVGLSVSDTKKLRVGTSGRSSTMTIAEKYLSGEEGAGVVSILLRQHAAADHGIETGLVGAVEDFSGPEGVNIMRPTAGPLPRLAFGLLAVPLSVIRAMQELRRHYQWPTTGQLTARLEKEQARTLGLWRDQVTQFEAELG